MLLDALLSMFDTFYDTMQMQCDVGTQTIIIENDDF